jgi:hypothetical protein
MTRTFAFARPGPEGLELCVVRPVADGEPSLIVVPISPMRALDLAHDLSHHALTHLRRLDRE